MRLLTRPNEYVLGGNVEIDSTPTDLENNVYFVPQESRVSVKAPTGDITTVSGDGLTLASGYLFYLYKPPVIGWYEYEVWHREDDRELVRTKGFEVTDRVY